jgi:HEAT repeat protein
MRTFAFVVIALISACADHAKQSVTLYESGDYAGASRAATDGLAGNPDDDALWGMRVRSALALGNADDVASAYAAYVGKRGSDDPELLRGLAIATLGQALASPSVKLKLAAIATVEDLELQPLADSVAKAMGDNDDRVVAAAAVAVFHGYQQAPGVVDDMLKSENGEARRIAVAGIAKKVGAIALADIEKAGNDPDPRVRRAAVSGLGALADKDAVEMLAQRLGDPDDGVRAGAARALAEIGIGDLAAFAKRALADKALAVRIGGVELLAATGQREPLVAVMNDADPIVALEAAVDLEQLGAPVRRIHGKLQHIHVAPHTGLGTPVVLRALASASWEVRVGATNLLDQVVGHDQARSYAQQLARDPDLRVRLAAARVLAHDGDRETAISVFRTALADPQAAADLVALDGDASAEHALAALVRDPQRTPEQRAEAASAHRTARHVTPGLVAALADPSGFVRVAAATALAALSKD